MFNKKMKTNSLILLIIVFQILLLFTQSNDSNQCVTGYKILVRQTFYQKNNNNNNNTQQQEQTIKSYKLKYKCLCPNNYYGAQCSYHISLYCYLQYLNTPQHIQITSNSINIPYELNFTSQCFLDYFENKIIMTELPKYLIKNNNTNAYGIREQFGQNIEIIWANTTQIFNQKHQLKIISEYQTKLKQHNLSQNSTQKPPQKPTLQQIHDIIIAPNTELYKTPFNYSDILFGYPFYNGRLNLKIQKVNPVKGVSLYKQLKTTEIDINTQKLNKYINNFNDNSKQINNNKNMIQNVFNNINIKDLIDKVINGNDKNLVNSDQYRKLIDNNNIQINSNANKNNNKKVNQLPVISIPIQLNLQQLASYQSILLQVSIHQSYQSSLHHQVSINSVAYNIPLVSQENSFQPIPNYDKNLIITDNSFKSYFKVLIVVGIALGLYFGIKYLHGKYQKMKIKEYTDDGNLEKNNKILKNQYTIRSDSIEISTSSNTQYYKQNKDFVLNQQK